ncbi:hypothetical protein M0R19_05235 [Candidatus Pacearchaeota archaeon]|nr:hypothetical protein [Candidatus Pacearchaeota archaeon]
MFTVSLNYICDHCENRGWVTKSKVTETSGSVWNEPYEYCKDFIGDRYFTYEITKELWSIFQKQFAEDFAKRENEQAKLDIALTNGSINLVSY